MQYLYYIIYLIAFGFIITLIVLIIELRKHVKSQRKEIVLEEEDHSFPS
jgi:hypothetical protein